MLKQVAAEFVSNRILNETEEERERRQIEAEYIANQIEKKTNKEKR